MVLLAETFYNKEKKNGILYLHMSTGRIGIVVLFGRNKWQLYDTHIYNKLFIQYKYVLIIFNINIEQ